MDGSESASLQQKTSPPQDPAAITHLTTELSAQATQLSLHHHQLNRLTSLTEDLVQTLQDLRASPVNVTTEQAQCAHAYSVNASANPCLAFTEKFDGNPAKCKGFLLQCTLYIDQQPSLYSNDAGCIAFVCSLLTGKALEWVTAVWRPEGSSFSSFAAFLQQFRNVFEQ